MKKSISRLNLFEELYQNLRLPDCYLNLSYKDKNVYNNFNAPKKANFLVYSNRLSPNYLKYSISKKTYKFNKIKQTNKGFVIDLAESSNAQEYINFHLSQNSRRTLKRAFHRLENSFNISYKMYYDNISKEEYDTLLNALETMLDKRMKQKNVKNEKLDKWKLIKENFYNELKKKNASIFVIYDSKIPVGISLYYLIDKVVFGYIFSFDIDYLKFGLGHVNTFKQIEWCYKNNYKVMELGYGDQDYKRKWCNRIYNFEHHILYKRNSVQGNILGKIEYSKIYIKEFLKRKRVDTYLKRLKRKRSYDSVDSEFKVVFNEFLETDKSLVCNEIDWKSDEFKFFKKIIYDFLYRYQENVNDVKLFSFDKQFKMYCIQGKNNMKKIIIS